MTLVVGTAGHIDHGKTTLLRALTGIDADRLPEEQRRGMTIDVGYAHLDLDDGGWIDFVDVPGHDRLVGNMLVGAGEVDAVLLVVAADDGQRPQTVEHLELVDALGIQRGVVAVTKSDAVDVARVEAVARDVRSLLEPTGLAAAPIVATSGATGEGIDALRGALVELATAVASTRPVADSGCPRLAIDRVFAVRGRGAVVTGTLRGGAVARGDVLRVEPGGFEIRVREVQVHGRVVESSIRGRTALNVAGAPSGALHRGQVVAAPGAVVASGRLLVALRGPAAIRGEGGALPADRARLRLHLGTDQVDVTVGRAGRVAVDLDDGRGSAVIRLERPVAAAAGDHFVLRRPSPGRTAAGGVVVDALPPVGVSRRRMTPERLAAIAAATDDAERARARLDLHGAIAGPGSVQLAPDVRDGASAAALAAVHAHHGANASAAGVPLADLRAVIAAHLRSRVTLAPEAAGRAAGQALDGLVAAGLLARSGDRLRDPAHVPTGPSADLLAAMDRLVAALDVAAPPPLLDAARAAGCPPVGVQELERNGRIVRLGPDLAWAAPAWERLARTALDGARRAPLTPAALRDATGTSRKYVMALLEDLDRRAVLARTPAGHVPGPRAATFEREPVA
jgi:selenocysteine-specific elongation factor